MKLVTIKINNRINKKINFSNRRWSSNNNFIIRDEDTGEPCELFSIKPDAMLIEGKTHSIVHVDSFQFDGNKVTVFLDKGKSRNKVDCDCFVFDQQRNEYVFKMEKPGNGDCIQVEFCLKGSNNFFSVFLYFASIVYDAIVDFGSEASQACWYKNGRRNNVNITMGIHEYPKEPEETQGDTDSQPTPNADAATPNLTDPVDTPNEEPRDEPEEETDDIRNYVQYESDTLYKSIYYIKKNLEDTELKSWPDYTSEIIKFLVSNEEEVDQLQNDYIQLPNVKLTQFDISNYANITVRHMDSYTTLSELQDGIVERILLNNIVLQTLYSIQKNAKSCKRVAYVVLNVLMPNVYPIHVISKKLNQLADDIKSLLKTDAFKNIKAVELRSVSESDASLLGYANSITSNRQAMKPGNYLIMDAGKGTLDFSLVEVDEHDGYVNRSKAGIIGAGNAITYGLIIGLVNDYLSETMDDYLENTDKQADLIQQFIFDNILNGFVDVAKLQKFHIVVEKYKKIYNELFEISANETETVAETETEASVEANANETTTHAETETANETSADETQSNAETNLDDLGKFTKWVESLCASRHNLTEASRKYVTIEIKNIAAEAIEKMGGIFNCIHELDQEETAVDYVVFTGRGFLMKEFQKVMLDYLKEAKIVKQEAYAITPTSDRMKAGCLDINQKLVGGQYDASPSRQTIGLLRNITADNRGNQNKSESSHGKAALEEKPDRPNDIFMGGYRRAQVIEVYSGDFEEDGIAVNGITADSSLSIGGWLYTINKRFCGRKSKVFFDGIHYWITAEGVDKQMLGGTAQQSRMASPLCFESLFPNVSIRGKEEVIVPKEREKPAIVQPLFFVDAQGDDHSEEDDRPKVGWLRFIWEKIKGLFIPEKDDDDEDESVD